MADEAILREWPRSTDEEGFSNLTKVSGAPQQGDDRPAGRCGHPPLRDVCKGDRNMKATGIVRRVEEYGIIGQKLSNPV